MRQMLWLLVMVTMILSSCVWLVILYAMENASPALLQVADQVAPHHKDQGQGVLTILEDYLGLY